MAAMTSFQDRGEAGWGGGSGPPRAAVRRGGKMGLLRAKIGVVKAKMGLSGWS